MSSGSISRRGAQGYDPSEDVNASTEGNALQFLEQTALPDEEAYDPERESRGKQGKEHEDEEGPEVEDSTTPPRR